MQTMFEFVTMSVFVIDLHRPSTADPFYMRYYYNIFVCGYQFLMFLAKLSIFLFVVRRIEVYAAAQFVLCAVAGLLLLFCRLD